jgi:FkbM family methyltransferase
MFELDSASPTSARTDEKKLKFALARLAVPAIRLWIRFSPAPQCKAWLWRKFSWLPVSFRARTRYGFLFAGDTRDMVPQYLYYFGVWEPLLSEFVRRRLRSGDTFIDVGSNVGYYSVLAASIVGSEGQVVSLDACKAMGDRLMDNARLNDLTCIRFVHGAVSDIEGEVLLFPGTRGNSGQASIVMPAAATSGATLVQVAPLARWIQPAVIERARLIKVDIEGAEGLLIRGSRELLPRLHPDCEVMMEINPSASSATGITAQDILGWMEQAGFRAYEIDNRYDYDFYGGPVEIRPLPRVHRTPDGPRDVVFSRLDAEQLCW